MVEVGRLYEHYGPLLTKRQRELVDLHYRQDLSLREIADDYGVSRQAVFDLVKRAAEALQAYEARLGLAGRAEVRRGKLERLAGLLAEGAPAGSLTAARGLVAELLAEEG